MKKNTEDIAARIEQLRNTIDEHNRRYYIDNQPVISDFEFDILINELQTLEKKYPVFKSDTSPTVRVGSDLSSSGAQNEFSQKLHKYPMLSLSNTYDKEELIAFNERVVKIAGVDVEYVCELKIDGSAISLTYHKGELKDAVTRGDGEKGDIVTENILSTRSVPRFLKGYGYPDEFEIRGEIFMPWSAFDRLNKSREENEEQLFANPRNAAAGSLKLLDSTLVKERGLEAILYHYISDENRFSNHSEALEAAKSWGLPVSGYTKICKSIEEVFNFLDLWNIERKKLPYPTDGVVIKVNNLQLQSKLGYTAKSPRWATAYKFKAERALTKLVSIDYQVGRTGAITPVANLEPVLLSGTIVKRASLHNLDQIELLDIHMNDYVYVEKGGEIIPKITGVELSKRDITSQKPLFPESCPDCGTTLTRDESEARHYCPNFISCPTQLKASLLHFCSRKAMNILAGDATIEQLYNKGFVRNISDFYKLTTEELLQLDGWKERSAERFLKSISDSVSAPFHKVLFSLGIRHVGETTAKSLASHFETIDNLANASKDELLQVDDVGAKLAESICGYFAGDASKKIILELKEAGLQFSQQRIAANTKSELLLNQIIVISGNFSVSRDEIKKLIEEHSGKNSGSVSSKTSFLLAGEEPGPSKIQKAKSLGIKILNEEEFMKLIENN